MKENLVYDKAFNFAKEIIHVYRYLCDEKTEYVLSKQILKSGTSIGANIKEGIYGQSKKDFLSKFSIALKECSETMYWLELLKASEYIDNQVSEKLINDCDEINRLLSAIVKTTKKTLQA